MSSNLKSEIITGFLTLIPPYKTYYRIVNKNAPKTPLIILHGGPGSTHNYFEIFDHLADEDNRPIVYYDQIGCGLSSMPEEETENFSEEEAQKLYRKETWVQELEKLREVLGLKEVHLIGHSWGGMLAIIYLCDHAPKGIKSVILSSTLSSSEIWAQETHRLLKFLPENYQKIIETCEANNNNFSSEEAQEAINYYMKKFVGGPWNTLTDAECIIRNKKFGEKSYIVAWGPSEFRPTGNLKNYDYTDKLKYIKCNVLLMSGVNDESTPYQNKIIYDNIQKEKNSRKKCR